MLLRISKVRQKGGDFAIIVATVTRITENISLEGLMPGVYPVLSIKLYSYVFTAMLNINWSHGKSKHQGISWGVMINREELVSLIPASHLSPGNVFGQGCYCCKMTKCQTASPEV